jgi:hypothetical protein
MSDLLLAALLIVALYVAATVMACRLLLRGPRR